MLKQKAQEELQIEEQQEKNLTKEEIDNLISNQAATASKSNFESLQSTKAVLKSLEQLFLKNQELRQSNEPEKFMESEEELHETLKNQIMPLSAESNPDAIKYFCQAEGIRLLVEIMDHPNTDISISCAAFLVKEITDEEQ